MNINSICEHNLEAHFLCNRTGSLCQAEWSSHLRKLRIPFFLNSGWNPFGILSLHTVMYKQTSKHFTQRHTTHKRFPCVPTLTDTSSAKPKRTKVYPGFTLRHLTHPSGQRFPAKHLSNNQTLHFVFFRPLKTTSMIFKVKVCF